MGLSRSIGGPQVDGRPQVPPVGPATQGIDLESLAQIIAGNTETQPAAHARRLIADGGGS
jgi:hypothetical protein